MIFFCILADLAGWGPESPGSWGHLSPGLQTPAKIFLVWHASCRLKLADNFGILFDRRVGTVVAVKGLEIAALHWGLLSPGLLTPPHKGLTACDDVYILDLTEKSRHTLVFSL